jgi:hypothetical protein
MPGSLRSRGEKKPGEWLLGQPIIVGVGVEVCVGVDDMDGRNHKVDHDILRRLCNINRDSRKRLSRCWGQIRGGRRSHRVSLRRG